MSTKADELMTEMEKVSDLKRRLAEHSRQFGLLLDEVSRAGLHVNTNINGDGKTPCTHTVTMELIKKF